MMLMESALAVRFRTKSTATTSIFHHHRPLFTSDDLTPPPPKTLHFAATRRNSRTTRIRCATRSGGAPPESDPPPPSSYHPFEGLGESSSSSSSMNSDDDEPRPAPAETARTLIEVNSKATLMFSGVIDDQLPDSIFWPDLPYLTDEHGNIYFEVKDEEDILQSLTGDDNFVQVIIGLDTMEMLNEMELGPSDVDYGFEDVMEDTSDDDDDDDIDDNEDYENDWVEVLDDEDDGMDSDGTLGDWAKLGTMRSSHPMYFAKKLSEVASDDPMMDCMDQPPPGLCIQGPLQPAFIEESSVIRKHMSVRQPRNNDRKKVSDNLEDRGINGHDPNSNNTSSSQNGSVWGEEDADKEESSRTGSSFYKLEMVKIQLISPHGNQTLVEVDDFQKAQPDAIAHSASKIISRLIDGGEKFIHALKSLCWRLKGIQVEEVILLGIDSLGFDLRVCSGKQVQNLRFAFAAKANSEYSAERQLHDLLFPRTHQKPQKKKETHKKEL